MNALQQVDSASRAVCAMFPVPIYMFASSLMRSYLGYFLKHDFFIPVWFQEEQARVKEILRNLPGVSEKATRATKNLFVFALIGLPQTGKTTVACKVANTLGAMLVSPSDWRSIRISKLQPDELSSHVAHAMTRQVLSAGYSVVIDDDYSCPVKRKRLEVAAALHGAKVVYLESCVDEDVWRKRLEGIRHRFSTFRYECVTNDDFSIGREVSIRQLVRRSVIAERDAVLHLHTRLHENKEAYKKIVERSFQNSGSSSIFMQAVEKFAYMILVEDGVSEVLKVSLKEQAQTRIPGH